MEESLHVVEALPAYALGSLSAREAGWVAEHLAECHLCRTELQAYQRIADGLPLAVADASPSAGVKPRLMEQVRASDVKQRTPTPAPSRRILFPRRRAALGALAGVALIAILAVSNLLLWQKVNAQEMVTTALGMRAIALQNSEAAPEASAFVVISADGKNGVLVVDALPPLHADQEYQAWLVRDGLSSSGGVFSVDEDGYRGMRIDSQETLLSFSSLRVTIEPVGGSLEPTGDEVLSGSLFNP